MANAWTNQPTSDQVERAATEAVVDEEPVVTKPFEPKVDTPSYEINQYLLQRVAIFRELTRLREKGWGDPAGDEFFARQRCQADSPSNKQAKVFFGIMKNIGRELHAHTGVFGIRAPDGRPPRILDMCMAPGGYLEVAMQYNPGARARAFTLPLKNGGHRVLLRPNPNIVITSVDITMMAADMGIDSIPQAHPDANNFLPRQLHPWDVFDLAICDGQVLRTHTRASYRENRESARLTLTQLAMSLEHLRPGGTILMLMHRIESWKSVIILRMFSKFSVVHVYKPKTSHRNRSSCYLVASNIQPEHEDAVRAVGTLKQLWRSATFDTEEEFRRLNKSMSPDVKEVLKDFGPRLVKLGKQVWQRQAEALAEAPWTQLQSAVLPSCGDERS
ncbi:FtsJ-like methyltransferase-domain-containing protein [Xylaria intraflava]|nr:FtsJ-like methyltransferase-domain-containing protein [Xylaria intraflava]